MTSRQEAASRLLNCSSEIAELHAVPAAPVLPLSRSTVYLATKRVFDMAASLAALICLGPLFLLTAILIKLRDGGPILFVQKRAGREGRLFDFYKFRSMVVGAERLRNLLDDQNQHAEGVTFKMKNDPRITWIGRIIRRTSVDELPQFLNVLRGDMTLVGPRPAIPTEVAKYSERERLRLLVTPGLTCYWQISGRADIGFAQQVELDIQYIEQQSLLTDLRILANTLPAVLSCRGAY